ncbi:hypothetical protein GQ54DRAFT_328471, partial [Martensiomyces pterosporus]
MKCTMHPVPSLGQAHTLSAYCPPLFFATSLLTTPPPKNQTRTRSSCSPGLFPSPCFAQSFFLSLSPSFPFFPTPFYLHVCRQPGEGMQLSTTVDHANNEVLVYQDTTGVVRGQIHIATKSKHKIKQVLIRLVRDELVDMADAEPTSPSAAAVAASSSGLLPILQKTSKIISTWVVLPERKDSHILAEGSHTYSFEISLPAGLDGSIDTVAYKLMYFLEARVKYPSILKPNDAVRTPITLIQVPMTTNLHSDDSISLSLS